MQFMELFLEDIVMPDEIPANPDEKAIDDDGDEAFGNDTLERSIEEFTDSCRADREYCIKAMMMLEDMAASEQMGFSQSCLERHKAQ